ncbi:MAG: topoisomerase DNA-binding C4 zinc finger domain-containing protein [Thaumarchaeota archaeon]|nr:topoisomerase DNA-binding C4 zinc finger domain-containing protein [Nitrososphaerota archaeon]
MILTEKSIQKRKSRRNVTKPTKRRIASLKTEIMQYFDSNSYLSWSASKKKYIILGSNQPKDGLVKCPSCHVGKLIVIRSRKTKKRFIGCSNYYNGCKASSPLLQKAMLRATKIPCESCSWPLVVFRYSRKQKWTKQCSNINCSSRKPKA